jgi:hypothetical protein
VDLDLGPRDVWSLRVPLFADRVSVDRASKTWHLLGRNHDADIVDASGTFDSDQSHLERWTAPAGAVGRLDPLAASKSGVLALEIRFLPPSAAGSRFVWLASFVQRVNPVESLFWMVDGRGASVFATSRLDVRCQSHALDNEGPTCAVFDGSRTGFHAVDPSTRRVTPLASIAGHVYVLADLGSGWFSAWWDGEPVLLRPASREAIRVGARDGAPPDHVAMTGQLLAAVWSRDNESTVRLYSIR